MPTNIPDFPAVNLSKMEADLNNEWRNLEAGYYTRKATRTENWKRYNFEAYGNERDGESKITDSTIYNTIEWMLPSLIQPFIETQDFVKVIPESASFRDIMAAEFNRELLNFQMRKRMDMYSRYYDAFKTMLIGGDSFIKLTWLDRDKKKGEPVGRPNLTVVFPDSIRYDWTVKGGFMHSKVVTHEEDWNKSQVLALRGEKGVIDSQLKKALSKEGMNSKTSYLRDEQVDDSNYIGEKYQMTDENKMLFLRREHWTEYAMNGDGKLVAIMAVFIDNCLVQVIENPYSFKHPPFVNIECVRDPQGNPAKGLSEILAPIQAYKTSIMRMTSNNLNSQLNGMYEVDQTSVDDIGMQLLMQSTSGSRIPIPVRKPGSINPLPQNQLAPQTFPILQMLEDASENRGGFPRYAQGLNPSSLSQTATGVVETSQRAEMRLWEVATRFAEHSLKPLVRMIIALNQDNLTEQDIEIQFGIDAKGKEMQDPDTGEIIKLDADPGDLIAVSKDDISGYFSVNLDIQVGSDKQNTINNLLQYAQYFAPYIENQTIPPEVITQVAVQSARLMGLPQIEGIVRRNTHVGIGNASLPGSVVGEGPGQQGASLGALQGSGADAGIQGTDLGGVSGDLRAPSGPVA